MPIHSKILVHWTTPKENGKNKFPKRTFEKKEFDKIKNEILKEVDNCIGQYNKNGEPINSNIKKIIKEGLEKHTFETVNKYTTKNFKKDKNKENVDEICIHLRKILKEGLLFNPIIESNWFNNEPKELPSDWICFTELKLSDTASESPSNHCDRYGYLGIGLHRKFVLENFGNPVFYVDRKDKLGLVKNIERLVKFTKDNKTEIYKKANRLLSFIKSMAIDKNDVYFKNYDDLEWRIVLDEDLKKRIDNKIGEYPPNVEKVNDGKYYLKFAFDLNKNEKCIECIIFPHEDVLYEAVKFLKNDDFFNCFMHKNMPILTTVNRIRHL